MLQPLLLRLFGIGINLSVSRTASVVASDWGIGVGKGGGFSLFTWLLPGTSTLTRRHTILRMPIRPPLTPAWIVRHHAPAPVHTVAISNNGDLLLAGDSQGLVSVTHLSYYRPLVFWKAHKDTVLRVDAWAGYLVTYVYNSHTI